MQRRTFLLSALALAASGLGLTAGTMAWRSARFQPDLTALMQQLQQWQGQLTQAGFQLQSQGSWNASQIFQHLAQSVAGSYQGYPLVKPAWFRHSIGPLALHSFKALGRMQHPLTEPIAGMPALDPALPLSQALDLLLDALRQFLLSQQLAEHFAYGGLTHADYQAAHWLHIRQHLSEISGPSTTKPPSHQA